MNRVDGRICSFGTVELPLDVLLVELAQRLLESLESVPC